MHDMKKTTGKGRAKAKEYGHLTKALAPEVLPGTPTGKPHKPGKPRLSVSAHLRLDDGYDIDDKEFRRQDAARLRKEIAALKKEVKEASLEDLGARAMRSLKQDLNAKTARLMEAEAYLDDDGDDEKEKMA